MALFTAICDQQLQDIPKIQQLNSCQVWPYVARCDQMLPGVTTFYIMWPAVAIFETRVWMFGKYAFLGHLVTKAWQLWPSGASSDQQMSVYLLPGVTDMLPGVTRCDQILPCDQQLTTVTSSSTSNKMGLWHYLLQYVTSNCKIYLKFSSWIVARCDHMLPGVTRCCQVWPLFI